MKAKTLSFTGTLESGMIQGSAGIKITSAIALCGSFDLK
jgi:hypothetical protein